MKKHVFFAVVVFGLLVACGGGSSEEVVLSQEEYNAMLGRISVLEQQVSETVPAEIGRAEYDALLARVSLVEADLAEVVPEEGLQLVYIPDDYPRDGVLWNQQFLIQDMEGCAEGLLPYITAANNGQEYGLLWHTQEHLDYGTEFVLPSGSFQMETEEYGYLWAIPANSEIQIVRPYGSDGTYPVEMKAYEQVIAILDLAIRCPFFELSTFDCETVADWDLPI